MRTRGEGVKKSDNFANVINGCYPTTLHRTLAFLVLAAALDPERDSESISQRNLFSLSLPHSGGNRDFWRSLISRNADFSPPLTRVTFRRHFLRRRLFPFSGGAAANKRGRPTPNLQQNTEKRERYSEPQK